MSIQNCEQEDLEGIYKLYAEARKLQTTHNVVVWPHFDKSLIVKEIENQQQWKILIDGEMACNWATTFVDKDIWEEKDQGDGIYIHRLATNPAFRGNSLVIKMVNWAKAYAKENNRKYVRLDTLGNNKGLIKHYTRCGFTFLGIVQLANIENLPLHYQQEPDCCLFELEV
jgi:ribosomal protein S18 acetylase RimI-like enzyme